MAAPGAPGWGWYVGRGRGGPVLAAPGRAVLVLGPPRAGKTTGLVVPNVLAAPGAVLTTSTKPDVLEATAALRGRVGTCWLYDPSGTIDVPPGVERLRWSPASAAGDWEDALVLTRAVAASARPGADRGEAAHWTERAEALIAPLLHAAALSGGSMADVARWVLRRDAGGAAAVLATRGSLVAADVLAGVTASDPRELSGIWSSAAGVLAAWRSPAALAAADGAGPDPADLIGSRDTIYVCAPAERQELLAPAVVALVERARAGAYRAAAAGPGEPLALVLDEVANVAPLPGLPGLVAEGGGQRVATLACLQDLSQARHRWGGRADGFPSLFGTTVVLPGIGDSATLELVSRLGGEVDVAVRSVGRRSWAAPPATTVATRRQRALPFDAVRHQAAGTALVLAGPAPPARVLLPPWWALARAPQVGAPTPRPDLGWGR